jgi:hypothetical protein
VPEPWHGTESGVFVGLQEGASGADSSRDKEWTLGKAHAGYIGDDMFTFSITMYIIYLKYQLSMSTPYERVK